MSSLVDRVIELAVRIQQIPAPTFHEGLRAQFVLDLFAGEDLKDVELDALGNVYARLACSASSLMTGRTKPPLIISAHLDTVFPDSAHTEVRAEARKVIAPGIGDNSLGLAALFGLLWTLRDTRVELDHDLWFVANVGEEGLGDLRGMRAVVDRFGRDVIGYLVLEGLALGHIYHRAIGVKRYRIRIRTAGGHSWSDYGQPSAVHELASLMTQLTSINLPREPRTTMNIGTLSGGSGINVIASESVCELDLRSEEPATLDKIVHEVEVCIRKKNRAGVTVEAEVIGQRPAGEISANHLLVQLAVDCTREQGLEAVLTSGSTDANIPLSLGIPAVVMGITTGGGAHTMHEYIDTEPVEKGMQCLITFVKRVGTQF